MYDAVIVGARCAGAPTAMLLARRGYKVLLLDRASFPSDTLNGHVVKKPAAAQLQAWGLLDAVIASGAPPIEKITFDVGPFALTGRAPSVPGAPARADADFAPRRTVLDKILVDAAVAAGAELRENFSVRELEFEDGRVAGIRGQGASGRPVSERARIVIGADGLRSLVAAAVAAPEYDAVPALTCVHYSYWENVPIDGAELCPRPGHCVIVFPTNDDLTCVFVQWPAAQFAVVRADLEANFMAAVALAPALAERVRAGRRVEPFRGTDNLPNLFRKPFGPGWALVGDAGLHRDPITAHGICDAFRDAELLTEALDAALRGRQSFDSALGVYEQKRNAAAGPIFGLTCQLAALAPPPPEMQQLFAALRGNQPEINRFIGTIICTVPIPVFFAPENLRHIIRQMEAR
jgi:2-polyprenyl-6-methoxyphenol hydroxylase-like FAD-dependent oxidoreductase